MTSRAEAVRGARLVRPPRQRQADSTPGLGEQSAPDPRPRRTRQWVAAVRSLPLSWVLVGVDLMALALATTAVREVTPRTAMVAAVALLLFASGGLNRARLSPSILDDLPALVGRALLAGALVTTLGTFDDGSAGRSILIYAASFALISTVLRAVVYTALRALRRSGRLAHRTLILGGGQLAGELATTLIEHPEVGLRPVGFLDDDPLLMDGQRPVPHLGKMSELADVILDQAIGNVIVAFGSTRESSVVDTLRSCDRLACEIFFVPRLYEIHSTDREMEMVWGIPLVRMRRAAYRTLAWRLKRAFDVVVSGCSLVVLTPVMLTCALLVRLCIGSPVLFRQERVGLDGRPFQLLKFCSLRPVDGLESAQRWNVSDDQRMTPLGRILRSTSIDELPQLWNILRGDMSLVGPRPERPFFVNEFTSRFPRYMARHRVPAGLTGAAQVHGLRGDTSIAERARFDNYYIENWSLWQDVKIITQTVSQVLRAAGR